MAGDAVVGEEVGRVGEDEVDAGFGDAGENVEAIALEDFEVMFGILEDGGRCAALSISCAEGFEIGEGLGTLAELQRE